MSKKGEPKNMNMHSTIATNRQDPGFWREAWQQARLVFYLLRDREVPFYLKLLPFLTILYLISPFDFPGGFDDATVLLVGGKVFIELVPQHVVIKHLNHIRQMDGYGPLEDVDGETAVADDINIIEGEIIKDQKDQA